MWIHAHPTMLSYQSVSIEYEVSSCCYSVMKCTKQTISFCIFFSFLRLSHTDSQTLTSHPSTITLLTLHTPHLSRIIVCNSLIWSLGSSTFSWWSRLSSHDQPCSSASPSSSPSEVWADATGLQLSLLLLISCHCTQTTHEVGAADRVGVKLILTCIRARTYTYTYVIDIPII